MKHAMYDDHINAGQAGQGKQCGWASLNHWFCTRPRHHTGYHEAMKIYSDGTQEYLETWDSDGKIKKVTKKGIKERWNKLLPISRQLILEQIGERHNYDGHHNAWDDLSVMTQIKIFRRKI